MKPATGDVFSLGPGYKNPMCFTQKSNQSGEWTWRGRVPVGTTCNLYIFGLNDSIDTTEFLEENYNASIDVEVWNYNTDQYDLLTERAQYGKSDCISVGIITPDYCSPDGDFRLRLIAHDIVNISEVEKQGIGISDVQTRRAEYAWFNYAVITPVPVEGRVNVNTAPARLLASVPGITPAVAGNIEAGIDSNGSASLKPYRRLGDILSVKDMTVDMFEHCANLLTVDSTAYTVEIEAQTVSDANENGVYDSDTDSINATRTRRYVMQLGPEGKGNANFKMLESM